MQTTLDQPKTMPATPTHVDAPNVAAKGARVLVALFVLSLLIPSSFQIAGLRLDAARTYALCMIIPFGMRWLAQDVGRPLPLDLLLMLHGFWIIVSLAVHHGTEQLALGAMTVVELFCGFLVGRILIRDATSFKFLFRVLLAALVVLLPFALLEMNNGRALLQEFFRSVLGNAHSDVYHPPRMGLYRAQTVMQHPILWGCFSAIVVANAYYVWRDRLPIAFALAGVAALACVSSMSSGAVLNLIIQFFLMLWSWLTKGAWKSLMLGFGAVYVFLSVASNRGPIVLMVTYLTFSPATGWGRIHIWNYGIDDALANPIFGIGLNDWSRPFWLASSIDNFWLLMMMRYGFVGFGLLAAALAWHIWKVVTAKGLSPYERRLREGYMISLVALLFSLSTVHFWGPPYLLMFAYVGAGVWFYSGPHRVLAPALSPAEDAEEGGAIGGGEVREVDLPFARSFAGSGARPEDHPLSRAAARIDAAPQSVTREDGMGFSRLDLPEERKRS
jgi:hypothetical protein